MFSILIQIRIQIWSNVSLHSLWYSILNLAPCSQIGFGILELLNTTSISNSVPNLPFNLILNSTLTQTCRFSSCFTYRIISFSVSAFNLSRIFRSTSVSLWKLSSQIHHRLSSSVVFNEPGGVIEMIVCRISGCILIWTKNEFILDLNDVLRTAEAAAAATSSMSICL